MTAINRRCIATFLGPRSSSTGRTADALGHSLPDSLRLDMPMMTATGGGSDEEAPTALHPPCRSYLPPRGTLRRRRR